MARRNRWSRVVAPSQGVFAYAEKSLDSVASDVCPICLEVTAFDQIFRLPCRHQVCSDCIGLYLKSRIQSGQVCSEQLSCPMYKCTYQLISDDISRIFACDPDGANLHQKLLDLQAQRFVPNADDHEKVLNCPTPDCESFLVSDDIIAQCKLITCSTCQKSFCAGCCEHAHLGMSCEIAFQKRMDSDTKLLVQRMNWVHCPVCRHLCERETGCNFMTCPSQRCQGRTSFCYICGQELSKAERFDHFRGFEGELDSTPRGPVDAPWAYGSACRNRPRLKNTALPTKPPKPNLSIVSVDVDDGSTALRLSWIEHQCDPPVMYYQVRVCSRFGKDLGISFEAKARKGYMDLLPLKFGLYKFSEYRLELTAANVNGFGPPSELSDIFCFSAKNSLSIRAVDDKACQAPPERRPKRWAGR